MVAYMRSKTELCERFVMSLVFLIRERIFDGIEYGRWAEARFCAHFYRATVK